MAMVLSLIPGLGHLLNGRVIQGLLWFCVVAVGYIFILPGIILHLICIYDAGRDARKKGDKKMQRQADLMADAISRRQ